MRSTSAGEWFLPPDGGAGSLVRVADGVGADAVRRIRDLGLPGLLPIGNVVSANGQIWLRTPQPPGPTLDEALRAPLTGADGLAVCAGLVRAVAGLHSRGLTHGRLDGEGVLLDPEGAVQVVLLSPGDSDPADDLTAVAGLARAMAAAWCDRDAEEELLLRRCAAMLEHRGPQAALDVLPAQPPASGDGLRRLAQKWTPPLPGAAC